MNVTLSFFFLNKQIHLLMSNFTTVFKQIYDKKNIFF